MFDHFTDSRSQFISVHDVSSRHLIAGIQTLTCCTVQGSVPSAGILTHLVLQKGEPLVSGSFVTTTRCCLSPTCSSYTHLPFRGAASPKCIWENRIGAPCTDIMNTPDDPRKIFACRLEIFQVSRTAASNCPCHFGQSFWHAH